MRTAVPRELRSWGDGIGILFRRWWWIAALVLILSWLTRCLRCPPAVSYAKGYHAAEVPRSVRRQAFRPLDRSSWTEGGSCAESKKGVAVRC